MNLVESAVSAFRGVFGHKMRSMLTMLGIIIGISSVITITSLGNGVKNTVMDTISVISKNVIEIYAQSINSYEDQMNTSDLEALSKLKSVDKITTIVESWGDKVALRLPGAFEEASLFGTDHNYSVLENFKIKHGRFISENDVKNESNVIVIKASMAVKIFGRENCLGEKVSVESWTGTDEFIVVGIFAVNEETMISQMVNTPISRSIGVIPYTTLNYLRGWGDIVNFMAASLKPGEDTFEGAASITDTLNLRHLRKDGYRAQNTQNMFDQIDMILNIVTGFVAFVAAISLFVGGVGVMNIMLVTVKERTREIGIRKALGATSGAIVLQFMFESILISLIGGTIGIVLGRLFSRLIGVLITNLSNTPVIPVVDTSIIIVAVSVSVLVGVIFGVYPAKKAAALDPVEALRYE